MLEVLRERVPEVSAKVATAEEIPANDRSVDVVVVAQAFHWFDHEAALPEIARVLKPGGHVALVWNSRDERIPWVRRMGDILGRQDLDTSSAEQLVHSDLFGFMEETTFKHWQEIDRESILDMARSRSSFAVMDEASVSATSPRCSPSTTTTAAAWTACGSPTSPAATARWSSDRDEPPTDPDGPDGPDDERADGPVVSDGTDTDMLLIDFR